MVDQGISLVLCEMFLLLIFKRVIHIESDPMLTKCIACQNRADKPRGYAYKVTQRLQSALPAKQGKPAKGERLQSDPTLTKCIACQNQVDLPRGYAYKVTQHLQSALPVETG